MMVRVACSIHRRGRLCSFRRWLFGDGAWWVGLGFEGREIGLGGEVGGEGGGDFISPAPSSRSAAGRCRATALRGGGQGGGFFAVVAVEDEVEEGEEGGVEEGEEGGVEEDEEVEGERYVEFNEWRLERAAGERSEEGDRVEAEGRRFVTGPRVQVPSRKAGVQDACDSNAASLGTYAVIILCEWCQNDGVGLAPKSREPDQTE